MFTVINISLRPFRPNLFSGRSPNGIIGVAGAKCILGSYDLFLLFFFPFTFCVCDRWFCQHIINQECSRIVRVCVCMREKKRAQVFLEFYYYYFLSFFIFLREQGIRGYKWKMELGVFHLFSFKSRDFVSALCFFPFYDGKMVCLGENVSLPTTVAWRFRSRCYRYRTGDQSCQIVWFSTNFAIFLSHAQLNLFRCYFGNFLLFHIFIVLLLAIFNHIFFFIFLRNEIASFRSC